MKTRMLLFTFMLCFNVSAAIIPTDIDGLSVSNDELLTMTDSSNLFDDAGFEMEFSYGSFNSPDHSFGLYHYDSASNSIASMLTIFDYSNVAGDSSNVVWSLALGLAATTHGTIDLSLASGLNFGLYFVSDGVTYYSQSALNAGGSDSFGFYWSDDPFSTTNLIVYAGDNGSGRNYDYIQVAIDDVRPIPEPGTIVLFGLALIGWRVMHKQGETNL